MTRTLHKAASQYVAESVPGLAVHEESGRPSKAEPSLTLAIPKDSGEIEAVRETKGRSYSNAVDLADYAGVGTSSRKGTSVRLGKRDNQASVRVVARIRPLNKVETVLSSLCYLG